MPRKGGKQGGKKPWVCGTGHANNHQSMEFDNMDQRNSNLTNASESFNNQSNHNNQTIDDYLPHKKVITWDKNDVGGWLKFIQQPNWVESFEHHEITGPVLLDINDAQLLKEIGIQSLGARKTILKGIESLIQRVW